MKMGIWGLIVCLSLTLGAPGIIQADLSAILLKFQPYVGVQEEYTNNVNLVPKGKEDAFITTVFAGLKYSTLPKSEITGEPVKAPTAEGEKYGVDLNAQAGFVYYSGGKADNYLSLNGTLNTWYTLANRLTFRVNDYLMRSDESREPLYSGALSPVYESGTFVDLTGQYLPGTQRQRNIWLRNVFSPSVAYQFSKGGIISLNYMNNVYNNQSSLSEDSVGNYINPKLIYWFDIRNGVTLEYAYALGSFDRSPDFTGNLGHGQYTHRFNRRTAVFGDYLFVRTNYDPPGNDYYVNAPSVGINHLFSPTLSGKVQVGYFWQSPERGKGYSGPLGDVTLTQKGEKTTSTLIVRGGYQQDYFTANNLGFIQYYTGVGTVTYRLLEKMTGTLGGSVEWNKWKNTGVDVLSNPNQRNTIWSVNGIVSYQVLKWLNLSLNVQYTENQSNIGANDYTEFRGLVKVEAKYL